MPNLLPLLLIGGGAAVVLATGKKKGRYKFEYLRVGPGCKTIFLNGKNFVDEVILIRDGDEDVRQTVLEDLKLFWLEDMPALIAKVQPDEEDLERGAEQLVKASLPSCYRSKQAMINGMKKSLKGAKDAADIEKRLMPHIARFVIMVLIYAGYQVNLVRDGKMSKTDLSDFEEEMMDVLPEDMKWVTGEGEGPVDPNQMAAMRPGWITEAVLRIIEVPA